MTTDGRRPGQAGGPEPVDPLALAEAVAAGRLGFAAAEAALWEAHPDDQGRAANEVAELRDLVTAIRGVRRHAEAVRRADIEVFDPDATSRPLGSSGPLDDDLGIAPRRVRGGDVRLRPAARQRQRWAPVGALAAAAVLVVAVAIVVPGLLAPSVASTPLPTAGPTGIAVATPAPSSEPSPTPTPANATSAPSTPPSPASTGVAGVPAIPSEVLAGAPGIAYWTLASEKSMTITEWRPDGAAPRFRFSVAVQPDPSTTKRETDRRVVVSPDGKRVVIAESTLTFARTRVFATDGTLLWTDPKSTFQPDLAWSADGTRVVIGSQPATWKILTFKPAGGPPAVQTRDFSTEDPNAAYRVLGFSESGDVLYGWATQGEADWWMTPFQVVIPDGKPITITTFTKKADPLAISNGTTAVTQVAPSDGSTTEVAGVDPKTYRVLDTGDLSGHLNGWEVRDVSEGDGTKLAGLSMDMSLAWTGDGAMVVADVTPMDRPATITTTLTENLEHKGPTFAVPAGKYWRLFEGCRNGYALLGLAAQRSGDAPWLGADELVLVELSSAQSSVLVPKAPGLIGIHPAGWITAP